jgi:hypothetical protein
LPGGLRQYIFSHGLVVVSFAMDYEVQRCSRCCAGSGRELAPGEGFYSVLVAEGAELRRYDYSTEMWKGPPKEAIGWWKSQIPDPHSGQRHWAPNDVMLQFFDELAQQPERQEFRYVLALLLVRRRVMRLEDSLVDAEGREVMVLYCPRREAAYQVPVVMPEQLRIEEIQQELVRLLE